MAIVSANTDIDIDLKKNKFTNDVAIMRDVNSIRQSIMNIILTLGMVYHLHQFVVLAKVLWKLRLIHHRQNFYILLQIKEESIFLQLL